MCAGAGGLALGLEQAGFDPTLLLELRPQPCDTLRLNRPHWNVQCADLLAFDPADHAEIHDIDLLAAGLPRVRTAATANRGRGNSEEMELLIATVMLLRSVRPRALLIENMAELAESDVYEPTRAMVQSELTDLGYRYVWFVLNAADFGVPQDRKHGFLVALADSLMDTFDPPSSCGSPPPTTGEALLNSMASRGWPAAVEWARQASRVAPTLVGGSWERGGADLGPTGSKKSWARMGVDGATVADEVPGPDFVWAPSSGRKGMVPLTNSQVAQLQGFPPEWEIAGRKTARYRQIANATPPPLARAVGEAIAATLRPTPPATEGSSTS
ncbi:DNA cytosine methyltransferase [Kocuria sp. CPCC 205316]|uniref:DNA cytosine methyltransferase n=1 Tax=Kocuria TaxID=57493 RepID=UPI0036DF12CC